MAAQEVPGNAVTRPPTTDVVLLVVAMLAIGTSGPLIAG